MSCTKCALRVTLKRLTLSFLLNTYIDFGRGRASLEALALARSGGDAAAAARFVSACEALAGAAHGAVVRRRWRSRRAAALRLEAADVARLERSERAVGGELAAALAAQLRSTRAAFVHAMQMPLCASTAGATRAAAVAAPPASPRARGGETPSSQRPQRRAFLRRGRGRTSLGGVRRLRTAH